MQIQCLSQIIKIFAFASLPVNQHLICHLFGFVCYAVVFTKLCDWFQCNFLQYQISMFVERIQRKQFAKNNKLQYDIRISVHRYAHRTYIRKKMPSPNAK